MKTKDRTGIKTKITENMKVREANTTIYYLDRMVEEIQRGYFCIFAGAGLSAASGYVDWKTLLEPMGKQLGLNMNMDLTLLAQYYENEFTRDELNNRILNEFAKIPKSNANMEILASMPIQRYWTTNYDSVIEDTLAGCGKVVDVITDQLQFKYHAPDRDAVVFKMHGDKTLPDKAVLSKNDYETYDDRRLLYTNSLMLDLISNTFLFIGFSFSDPNLDRIIAIVKRNFKGATLKKHYCFMRNICIDDYLAKEDEEAFIIKQYEQDRNAQECKIQDMRRYGIETILIDDFEQITRILIYMKDKLKLNSVFISGGTNPSNPSEYGEFQDKKGEKIGKAEGFIMQLANKLIIKNYKIITGFGIGIGNYIVAGAYMRMVEKRNIRIEEKIFIQPMVSLENENDLELKNQMREELLDKCGVVVTIFGKSDVRASQEELEKDGTYIEYKLAEQKEKIIIPVGATGFTSKIIYEEEKHKWDKEYLYSKLLDKKIENDKLIECIIDCIEYKKKEKEKKMREVLVQNLSERLKKKKKVFISFSYSSSAKYVSKIIDIIERDEKYYVCKELEKCDDSKVQQWIDEKMQDIDLTIIFFDENFLERKWTHYEVKQSVEKNVPLLFLISQKKEMQSKKEKFIVELKITKYSVLIWKKEKDFVKIIEELDRLL